MNKFKILDAKFKFVDSSELSIPNVTIDFSNILLIKGKAGSGKSLILKSCGGIIGPSEGVISVTDYSGKKLDSYFLHSHPEFNFVTSSVRDELELAGISEIKELKKYLNRSIYELSGGELKKISLLIALNSGKDLLILDDPLDALDDKQTEIMSSLLLEYSNKIPLIMAIQESSLFPNALSYDLTPFNSDIVEFESKMSSDEIVFSLNNFKIIKEHLDYNLTFDVKRGESVCIFGHNGSGKTLFVKSIAGIGKIPFSGTFIFNTSHGFCLQFPEHMCYESDMLKEVYRIAGDKSDDVFKSLGCEELKGVSPFAVSNGKKRILFITALLLSKDFCIFDEPFAGLDTHDSNTLKRVFLKALSIGKSIMFTANRVKDMSFSDKVIHLDGKSV